MGCGMSMMNEEAASSSHHPSRCWQHATVSPIADKTLATKKDSDNGDEGVCSPQGKDNVIVVTRPLGEEEAKTKEVESNEAKCMEKMKEERIFERQGAQENGGDDKHGQNEKEHEENTDIDDNIVRARSPSFRQYCANHDSMDQGFMGDLNDCESGESTKNCSEVDLPCDDDSTNKKNDKPKDVENVNSNKENVKKESKGRRFRNVINKGKSTIAGRRNLLNFACYHPSSASREDSLKEIDGKTTST